MKKSMIVLLLIALALLLPAGGLAEISGSGTEGDPYIVNDFYELESVTDSDFNDPTTPVYVRLGDNVTGNLWTINQRTVVLDLNGKTLSRPSDFTGKYNGSVICIQVNGSLTLEDSVGGGTITGGYSTADDGGFGGGVTLLGGSRDDFCTLIMKGGTITGNKAVYGGAGVHVKFNSTFIMEGGEITGNMNSDDSIGGVCALSSGVIRISGAPKIRGNYAGSGEGAKESNVFLIPGVVIQIDKKLEAGASIGVTIDGGTGVFTSGLPGNGGKSNFFSDNEKFRVDLTGTGEAVLRSNVLIKRTITFKVVNGSWNDGTKADKIVVLSCYDDEDTVLKLDPKDIPAVGSWPAKGYKAGSWDKTPDTDSRVEEDLTYTYAYREAPIYEVTSGDGQTWTKGKFDPASFTFKGSPNDANTFDNFTGIRVDGADVGSGSYSAKKGSVVIDLNASYLESLADGDHTLTAVFTDGEASAKFTVQPSPGKKPADTGGMPKTGDWSHLSLWAALAAIAVAGLIIRRKK